MTVIVHTCCRVLSLCLISAPELPLVQENTDVNFSVREFLNLENLKGSTNSNPTFVHGTHPKYKFSRNLGKDR